jgi:hypothetical protein
MSIVAFLSLRIIAESLIQCGQAEKSASGLSSGQIPERRDTRAQIASKMSATSASE